MQSLLQHEITRIKQSLHAHPAVQAEAALLLKALAAVTGKLEKADLAELRQATLPGDGIVLPTAIAMQRTALWQNHGLPEMQPDILAAQMLHSVLLEYLPDDASMGAWCGRF